MNMYKLIFLLQLGFCIGAMEKKIVPISILDITIVPKDDNEAFQMHSLENNQIVWFKSTKGDLKANFDVRLYAQVKNEYNPIVDLNYSDDLSNFNVTHVGSDFLMLGNALYSFSSDSNRIISSSPGTQNFLIISPNSKYAFVKQSEYSNLNLYTWEIDFDRVYLKNQINNIFGTHIPERKSVIKSCKAPLIFFEQGEESNSLSGNIFTLATNTGDIIPILYYYNDPSISCKISNFVLSQDNTKLLLSTFLYEELAYYDIEKKEWFFDKLPSKNGRGFGYFLDGDYKFILYTGFNEHEIYDPFTIFTTVTNEKIELSNREKFDEIITKYGLSTLVREMVQSRYKNNNFLQKFGLTKVFSRLSIPEDITLFFEIDTNQKELRLLDYREKTEQNDADKVIEECWNIDDDHLLIAYQNDDDENYSFAYVNVYDEHTEYIQTPYLELLDLPYLTNQKSRFILCVPNILQVPEYIFMSMDVTFYIKKQGIIDFAYVEKTGRLVTVSRVQDDSGYLIQIFGYRDNPNLQDNLEDNVITCKAYLFSTDSHGKVTHLITQSKENQVEVWPLDGTELLNITNPEVDNPQSKGILSLFGKVIWG